MLTWIFKSHVSDDSAKNAGTAFEHIKVFINWIYENNLFIKNGIIYDIKYVCSKQYRYANTMQILSVLAFTYRVIIDRCINYPVHVRRKIDGINGSYKLYLRQKYALQALDNITTKRR